MHFIQLGVFLVLSSLTFASRDSLIDTGWWSDIFRNPPRAIPMYCKICRKQRMHRKSNVSPVFEQIYDGDRWRIIIVGLYFECHFCLQQEAGIYG